MASDPRYALVYEQGQAINAQQQQINRATEIICGWPRGSLTIIKGGNKKASKASGQTHNGLGVEDNIAATQTDLKIKVKRKLGVAIWPRDEREGFEDHAHGVTVGDTSAHPTAQGQVAEFLRGGDGLIGGRPDRGPHMPVYPRFVFQHPGETHDLTERVCVVACHKYDWQTAQSANHGPVPVGTKVTPVAMTRVPVGSGWRYWFLDEDGNCYYEANFAKVTAPIVTKPVPATPAETVPVVTPTPAPVHAAAVMWGGYGNMFGGYNRTDKGWYGARAEAQARRIVGMGVSWFAALELHEENGMLAYFMSLLPDHWDVMQGKGGNHFLYDGGKYNPIALQNLMMPGNRWMTKFNVERIDAGVPFWVPVTHLTAGVTKRSTRVAQAAFVVKNIDSIHRGILCWDRNTWSGYKGGPVQVSEAAGWEGLRAKTDVVNGSANSHKGTTKNQWIEDMQTRELVEVLAAEQVDTGKPKDPKSLSDHNWFKAKFAVPAIAG